VFQKNSIYIIVPVYNEKKRALDTVVKILKNTKSKVVVVDDGSTDGSGTKIKYKFKKSSRVVVLRHIINQGKGSALKTGVEFAWREGAKAVIFVDADGQHNPEHLPRFERCLDKYSIVFGFRRFNQKMPFIRKYGNMIALKLVDILFGICKKDLLSGYLGFRKEVYPIIEWSSQRYGIETEMAAKIGRNKLQFKEIKIDTIYIDKYKGVTILDAFKILVQIPFWYFSK